jgi:hypothetical protein
MKLQYLQPDSKKGFSVLAGINRVIVPSQTTKLSESIKLMGVIRPVIISFITFISGKKLPYIIDGQHLYNACIKLSVAIPYVVIDIKDKQDLIEKIALLNSSSKSWSMNDYVTAWSYINSDYSKLRDYYNQHDLEFSILASVLSGSVGSTGSIINKKIKNGSFRVVNEKYNAELLTYIDDMLSIIPRMNRFENKYVCGEFLKFVKNTPDYKHEQFMIKLKRNKNKFVLATQEEGKLNELFEHLSKNRI